MLERVARIFWRKDASSSSSGDADRESRELVRESASLPPHPGFGSLPPGTHSPTLYTLGRHHIQDTLRSSSESRLERHSSDPHHQCKKTECGLQNEIEKLRARMREREAYFERAQGDWAESNSHLQVTAFQEQTRLSGIISEKDSIIASMKEKDSKLRSTLVFLNSEDRCSASDVTALVKALNYEILQVSTAVAEELSAQYLVGRERRASIADEEGACERVGKLLGSQFYRELEAANHKEDPTLLQLAFQALLCLYCEYLIGSWDKDTFRGLSYSLDVIYRTMKKKEPQPVFAQWRALTQRQLYDMMANEQPKSIATTLGQRMIDVVVAANLQHSDQVSEWSSSLAEKLQTIESSVDRIRNAITLEFVSGDFTMVYVHPGTSYDGRGMRDAFESGDNITDDTVACTTELGLRLTKKVTKGDQSHEQSLLLLEPQVFLDSTLRELVRPA